MHMSIAGPNALDPARMAPEERFAEIGRILALGLTRLNATKSTGFICKHRRQLPRLLTPPTPSCRSRWKAQGLTMQQGSPASLTTIDPARPRDDTARDATVLARLAALKTMSVHDLRAEWTKRK